MWTRFMCAFFNGEHPLTVSEQSQEVLSEIKCCNYQILCSLKMALKLKLSKCHINAPFSGKIKIICTKNINIPNFGSMFHF